jgi:hypothetical protein
LVRAHKQVIAGVVTIVLGTALAGCGASAHGGLNTVNADEIRVENTITAVEDNSGTDAAAAAAIQVMNLDLRPYLDRVRGPEHFLLDVLASDIAYANPHNTSIPGLHMVANAVAAGCTGKLANTRDVTQCASAEDGLTPLIRSLLVSGPNSATATGALRTFGQTMHASTDQENTPMLWSLSLQLTNWQGGGVGALDTSWIQAAGFCAGNANFATSVGY